MESGANTLRVAREFVRPTGKYIGHLLAMIVVVGCVASSSQQALAPYLRDTHETEENRSVAIFEAPVNPRLPSVLIIGDSISISYTLPVRQRLEGIANVIHPVANCESTLTILEKLDRWLGQTKWAVIHFNAGLHDLAHVQSEGVAPGKQDARSHWREKPCSKRRGALQCSRPRGDALGVEIDDLNSALVESAYRFQKPERALSERPRACGDMTPTAA